MALTPSEANTALDICSRALILIGAEPISSFDDGSTEALVCVNLYEDVVRTALTNTRWRFATNQKVLNRLTDIPTGRFNFAYQIPQDNLMVHAVTVNDNLIEYQIYGDKIYSNTSENDEVISDYSFRASELDFPSYFTLAVQFSFSLDFIARLAFVTSGCSSPIPEQNNFAPPPVPVDSITGALKSVFFANLSATIVEKGNTVDEPTIDI